MEISKMISKLRNEKGLNQRDFAKLLGVSSGAIGMWETGKRQPDLDTVQKIASFFNVPTDYLLGVGVFENWDTLLKNKTAIIQQISVQAQQLALNVSYGIDDISFAKLVYAFDIQVITHEDGEIGISGKDPIPTYTENHFPNIVDVNPPETRILSLYRSASDADKKNIVDLLNSFCALQERRNKIMILGRCFELEDSESVAAEEALKKAK